jgi:hypothetical protein
MAFFQSFTHSIRQKWLQFFQLNRDWISLHMTVESVYTPDGGKRPPSYLILGVVNALEPKLAQLMFPFARLNPDADTLIEVLDLNFDPDIALGHTLALSQAPDIHSNTLDEDSFSESSENSTTTDEFHVILPSEPKLPVSEPRHSFAEVASEKLDDFSFESETVAEELLDDEGLGDFNALIDEDSTDNGLSDVWGDESYLEKGEDNRNVLGEELPSEVFNEAEIARLFPNS